MAEKTAQHPPFIVGKPVTGVYFVDREEELKKLVILTRGLLNQSSSNSILIGLRRTGKSSIQENLEIRLKSDKKIIPVIVSCYGISSKSRLAKLLSDKTIESYVSKTGDKSYWKRLRKAISEKKRETLERISEVRFTELSIRLKDKEAEGDALIEEALQFIESLAEDKRSFFVIMLDEFQDVVKWGEGTLKRMRTIIQSQKRTCYVISGSRTSIMRDLVYKHRSPFYKQLVEIPVKKIDPETLEQFMRERFATVGIRPKDDQLRMIVTYSDGYPDYAQRMGLELFLEAGEGGKISDASIDLAYHEMIQTLDGDFENYFSTFSPLEREILIALAIGKRRASEVATEVRNEMANISKTLKRLVSYGVIEKPLVGQYKLADSVFSQWLRERYGTSLDNYYA
jgi:ATPase domain predominantly from Archaea